MFNLTVKEYGDLIASLKISDLIIYYFLGDFFIILIQRIIGVEIDTDNKLRTNPKILLGLFFLYFLGLIGRFIGPYVSFDNSFERVTIAAMILVCVIYLLYKVIFSRKRGLIFFLYKNKNERLA